MLLQLINCICLRVILYHDHKLRLMHISTAILNLGLPDSFLEHGKVDEMLADCGLDSQGILKAIKQRLA